MATKEFYCAVIVIVVRVVVYSFELGTAEDGEHGGEEGNAAWSVVLVYVEYDAIDDFITVVNINYVFIL